MTQNSPHQKQALRSGVPTDMRCLTLMLPRVLPADSKPSRLLTPAFFLPTELLFRSCAAALQRSEAFNEILIFIAVKLLWRRQLLLNTSGVNEQLFQRRRNVPDDIFCSWWRLAVMEGLLVPPENRTHCRGSWHQGRTGGKKWPGSH